MAPSKGAARRLDGAPQAPGGALGTAAAATVAGGTDGGAVGAGRVGGGRQAEGAGGLTRRMVVASGLLAVIVGAAFAALLVAVADLRATDRRARHSQQVLVAANQLERLVIDLETGVRGFVIAGQERFLAPWRVARAVLPQRARTLEGLVAGDRAQQARAQRITQAATAYLRDYSVPLVDLVQRDPAAARTVAATQQGTRRVDAIRVEFDQLVATEGGLAATRQRRSEAAARQAIVAAAGGLAGSVLLIVVVAGYLTRAIVRPVRRAAAMAGRLAGGDLGARVPQTGVAEIGTLEGSFNAMAGSLEASRDQLAASRVRIVTAADQARRRIERDLHDGVQQRLVALGLDLRAVQAAVPAHPPELGRQLARIAEGLGEALAELQELSRGIHPAVLSEGGLGPALKVLARRAALPVELGVDLPQRPPTPVEVAAYYVVAEALTNAAKHAHASVARVDVRAGGGRLRLSVVDDGVGGADPAGGSGLVGLTDRVQALGGTITVHSPVGAGTTLLVDLPVGLNASDRASGP
jgi:signal transduction histidine kinase